MRSFVLFLKRVGLQKIVAIFIAVMLIAVATIYIISRPDIFNIAKYQKNFDEAKYGETIPDLEKWLQSHKGDISAMELLAALYIQKVDSEPSVASEYLDKAIALLQDIIKIDGNRDESYRLMGVAYLYKSDTASAQMKFIEAVKISKNKNLNAQVGLGMIQEAKGNWNAASSIYKKVTLEDSKNEAARLGMGRVYLSKNMSNEAAKEAQSVLEISKNNASIGEAYSILGSAMKIMLLVDDSVKNYRESLKYRPGNVHTMILLGEALKDSYLRTDISSRPTVIREITDIANKAISLKPDYALAYTLLYKVNLMQNNYAEAAAIGKKIVALAPADKTLTDAQKREYVNYYGKEITAVTVTSVKMTETTMAALRTASGTSSKATSSSATKTPPKAPVKK